MNNKGFTLVELVAIIILLAALSVLTYVSVSNIISRQKANTFKQTLNGIIDTATIYSTDNKYVFTPDGTNILYDAVNDQYRINLKGTTLKMNSSDQIVSGWVVINSDTTIEVENVYNGLFCAISGSVGNYNIKKGTC